MINEKITKINNIVQLESIASVEQIQKFVQYIFEDIYLHTLLKRFRLVYQNKKIDKLNFAVFNLSNMDKQIIVKKSFMRFCKYVLQTQNYELDINDNFIYQLFNKYLSNNINNYLQKLINQYNNNIDNNIVAEMNELHLVNIPIGQSINLNSEFYENLHKFFITPVIYVNGNIIGCDQKFTVEDYIEAINSCRMYHFNLLDMYLSSTRKYHDNDIKPIPKECTHSIIEEQYAYARIIFDGEVFIIMSMNTYCTDLISLLSNKFHKPIFLLSDNATKLEHVAKKSRLKYKCSHILVRLM